MSLSTTRFRILGFLPETENTENVTEIATPYGLMGIGV